MGRVLLNVGPPDASEVTVRAEIYGTEFTWRVVGADPEQVAPATKKALDALVGACVAEFVGRVSSPDGPIEDRLISAIPYAFGAVPLRPAADLFNQLPHGLFGALVVEPKGATYAGRNEAAGEYAPVAPPRGPSAAHRGRGSNTEIRVTDAAGKPRMLREYVLFYQDGLNLWDSASASANRWLPIEGGPGFPIVEDCGICDDSYDWGEKAVSYRAPAFHRMLRDQLRRPFEAHDDLNDAVFPPDFLALRDGSSANPLRLWARSGEEVLVRVVHPGGRARQRAFVTVGNDYDDQFPGFGFPHAALLGPGKAVSAAFAAPVRPECYVWSDGPREIEAAGAWGLLDVLKPNGASSCGFLP